MKKQDEERLYEDTRYEIKDLKKAFLVGCYLRKKDLDTCYEHLHELGSLATTYGFEIAFKARCSLRKIEVSTYLGKGKLTELIEQALQCEAEIIIFDEEISPNQQKNLERLFKKPVIDRTELILEIFSKRAHTKEAKLQVELARSSYLLPRLKRLWTHLSRQRTGGKGFLKGEGERQIEIDRRLIRKRVSQLKKEIEEVRLHRMVQREARVRSPIPTFGIVGYTNAGKSTLLRALTQAEVLIEDKLFATLDTTTRKFKLPNHQDILLIDTVGFIRKIPHTLVAAFKSTLEEAFYTDILIHMIDINHPLALEHAEATYKVLDELNIKDKPIITILNKIDLVKDKGVVARFKLKYPRVVPIAASSGQGLDRLTEYMVTALKDLRETVNLRVPQKDYAVLSQILEQGDVLYRDYEGNDVLLKVQIPKHLKSKVKAFMIEDNDT